jgi:hypothetical protein
MDSPVIYQVEYVRNGGYIDFIGITSTLELALAKIAKPSSYDHDIPPYTEEQPVGFIIHMVKVDDFYEPIIDTFNSLGISIYGS